MARPAAQGRCDVIVSPPSLRGPIRFGAGPKQSRGPAANRGAQPGFGRAVAPSLSHSSAQCAVPLLWRKCLHYRGQIPSFSDYLREVQ